MGLKDFLLMGVLPVGIGVLGGVGLVEGGLGLLNQLTHSSRDYETPLKRFTQDVDGFRRNTSILIQKTLRRELHMEVCDRSSYDQYVDRDLDGKVDFVYLGNSDSFDDWGIKDSKWFDRKIDYATHSESFLRADAMLSGQIDRFKLGPYIQKLRDSRKDN